MNDHADWHIAARLAFLLFGIYLLSFSGRLYSQDSMLMFSVTESFVKRGEFSTDQMWTLYKARNELGPDGEAYSKTGYGTSLFAAPLYALALVLPGNPGLVQTTLLTSSMVIALTGGLVFLVARRVQFSRGVSVAAALLFGLATPAWVYAKQLWSEPYALFTLCAAFYCLSCFRHKGHQRDALCAGIALGLAVAIRATNAALVPFFMWYGFWTGAHQANEIAAAQAPSRPAPARNERSVVGASRLGVVVDAVSDRRNLRGLAWFTFALVVFALAIAYYNWVRYGSPFATGYRADEAFDNPLLLGMYGLLFSPGKGLFIYVPFLAALPWSVLAFYRRARRELLLSLAILGFYVVTFSMWYYWWGGTNWGPRFLVPTLGFLVLLIAPAIELALPHPERRERDAHRAAFAAIFAALGLLSLGIQILGISIPSLAYRTRMLRFSPNPEADAIFLPQFSPLVGYFNLFRPSVLDFAWIRVVDDVVTMDWLVIALTVAFVIFSGVMLYRSLASSLRSLANAAILGAFAAVLALSLFSLYRYRDDFRFGGGDGYRALLQRVEREAQPRDVMILDDDARMLFFFNENRTRVRWYGLSRDPTQWDDATRALLTRLAEQYTRIWFAFDDATASLPDPTRDWLEQSLRPIAAHDFDDGVHLILFATDTSP